MIGPHDYRQATVIRPVQALIGLSPNKNMKHISSKLAESAIISPTSDFRSYGTQPNDALDPATRSPLWMVTSEPLLNEFVLDLKNLQQELSQAPLVCAELRFSRARIEAIRAAFSRMIRHGEEALHQLSLLLANRFLNGYQLQSVVIGAVDTTQERFTLSQTITPADLFSTTDIDLGNRQLSKLQFFDGTNWSRASLVANTVDYQPTEPNPLGIHRISTRIKAEEQIWNKVVDELFDLDHIVRNDKQLRHLSQYVKDIFGIKLVIGSTDDIYRVQRILQELEWSDEALREWSVTPSRSTRRLEWVEVKDYIAEGERKRSGWEALKSVVRWSDRLIEIQIQPLRNFLSERERLTSESHVSFKLNRERVRAQVAERIPLFSFYQELLRWLFLDPAAHASRCQRVSR
jgi:hypothetical protein